MTYAAIASAAASLCSVSICGILPSKIHLKIHGNARTLFIWLG